MHEIENDSSYERLLARDSEALPDDHECHGFKSRRKLYFLVVSVASCLMLSSLALNLYFMLQKHQIIGDISSHQQSHATSPYGMRISLSASCLR